MADDLLAFSWNKRRVVVGDMINITGLEVEYSDIGSRWAIEVKTNIRFIGGDILKGMDHPAFKAVAVILFHRFMVDECEYVIL